MASSSRNLLMIAFGTATVLALFVLVSILYHNHVSGDEDGDLARGGITQEFAAKYRGHRVIRAIPRTDSQVGSLRRLAAMDGVTLWNEPVKGVPIMIQIAPQVKAEILNHLTMQNIKFTFAIFDLEQVIMRQIDQSEADATSQKAVKFENFDLSRYHPYEAIMDFIEEIIRKFGPTKMVTSKNIATTYEGRKVVLLKLSHPDVKAEGGKNTIFMECGIHAREWLSNAVCLFFVHKLLTDPAYGHILDTNDIHIIPLFNPDGYAYTWTNDRLWRKNRTPAPEEFCDRSGDSANMSRCLGDTCSGVDLNRNFDANFGGDGSEPREPCSQIFTGREAFSEAEAAGLRDYLMDLKEKEGINLSAYLSIHTYSQYWLYPWGYKKDTPPDRERLEFYAKAGAEATGKVNGTHYRHGSASESLYLASGMSTDWAYDTFKPDVVLTIEMRDRGFHGFIIPADQILATGHEMAAGIQTVLDLLYDKAHENFVGKVIPKPGPDPDPLST